MIQKGFGKVLWCYIDIKQISGSENSEFARQASSMPSATTSRDGVETVFGNMFRGVPSQSIDKYNLQGAMTPLFSAQGSQWVLQLL
jgi:hypothetical protein